MFLSIVCAFLVGQGNIGVVSLHEFSNKGKKVPILHAHSGKTN